MKVLKVIHGFPPDYMAGSEVYSYHLVKALREQGKNVSVFTSVENAFDPEYKVYNEKYQDIPVRRINKFRRDYQYQDKFYDSKMDNLFKAYLEELKPDLVHFGHLSHLSTQLIAITKQEYGLPIVFTIHDFWMFCVKGQLINQEGKICQAPSVERCLACSPYHPTKSEVEKALKHMQSVIDLVDIFLSPSLTLRDFYIKQGVPKEKVVYSKYGFDTRKISYRPKSYTLQSKIKFGFMGRIIPTKGIRVLIDAFKGIDATLNIYGQIGSEKRFLQFDNIHFKGSYDNHSIQTVLANIDILIVPSLWYENSPLVIQEAFLAGIPVITSNLGGMKELVNDGVNGYLFEVGNAQSLQNLILKITANPIMLNSLTVSPQDVRDIQEDARFVRQIYHQVKKTMTEKKPWRITIDTNPDQCNLNCIMCDTHSIYATKKSVKRKRMEATLLRDILIEAKQIGIKEIIPSTMGEPLLYPYFHIFIDEIYQSNIKLNLTTKGTFPKLGAEAWGKKLLPITSDTKISINGISPNINEKVMVNAQTEELLNNIKTYLTIRDSLQSQPNPSTVTLQVTFMKNNLEGIREVIEFAIKHKINRVKGHHLWVNWQQLESEDMRHPDNIAIWNQFINSIALYRRHIKLENFDKLAEKYNIERLIPDTYECPFLGQELWINQDGNYNVCCAPSEKRLTLGDFGSFKEMGILEMFNSKQYEELCLNYKTKEICQTCLLRKPS